MKILATRVNRGRLGQALFRIILPMFVLMASVESAQGQPAGLLERAFFYNDIYHFVGRPFPAPAFGDVSTVSQPFASKCSGLNRIITSFYVRGNPPAGSLKFNLYESADAKKLVFSEDVELEKFPPASKIGTHHVNGVLFSIWLPPQKDSRNKDYIWELKSGDDVEPGKVGVYFTASGHRQLQAALVDGKSQTGNYAAFYSYCRFGFDGGEIIKTVWDRMFREKYFFGLYIFLMGGGVFSIVKLRSKSGGV